ncbi:MAG: hypothetical protein ACOZNI_08405 [Myxococcota bacterium]
MKPRPHPPAHPHGALREVLPGVWFVTGTVAMAPGMRFSRNMTVVRDGERLVVINSVRLSEEGLKGLDALGKVTDVIRLAGFHGSDDAFYKERYGAKVWAIAGQRYTAGFDPDVPEVYFEADVAIDASTPLPLPDATIYLFGTKPPEGMLLLAREGGVVVSGDCLQHWAATDPYFSVLGTLMMKAMGFIRPHNVGPGWLKQAKPAAAELRGVLDLPFQHVLPAHGEPVLGDARTSYRPALERAAASRA